jgi:hypothetical protein
MDSNTTFKYDTFTCSGSRRRLYSEYGQYNRMVECNWPHYWLCHHTHPTLLLRCVRSVCVCVDVCMRVCVFVCVTLTFNIITITYNRCSLTQAAVGALSSALAIDARQNFPHIAVQCIYPGSVATDIVALAAGRKSAEELRGMAEGAHTRFNVAYNTQGMTYDRVTSIHNQTCIHKVTTLHAHIHTHIYTHSHTHRLECTRLRNYE